ncbi:MAG: universal stress protein [Gemmatimonadota bacterium]|jgi:nucleotide-binding universal stress UspA family protein
MLGCLLAPRPSLAEVTIYSQLLVPLDGSRFGEAALPLALRLSHLTGARIHLVTVQELLPAAAPAEWQNATQESARAYLEDVAEGVREASGGEVTTSFRVGHVVDELLEEAWDADLVVMATHGWGMISRAWLGSVADAFSRNVPRPVLMMRPETDGGDDALGPGVEWSISKMLLPLDGTPLSEAIIDHATELGSLFGASYHLVRVVPLPKEFSSSYLPDMIRFNKEYLQESEKVSNEYLEAQARRLRAKGFEVDATVLVGAQPVHGILSEAEASESDLIAVSAHHRAGLTRALLGSTSDKVLRGSPVPVLLYRHAE